VSNVDKGRVSKESSSEVRAELLKGKTIVEAIKEKSKGEMDLEGIVNRIIDEKADFVKERGMFAQKPIMGLVMKETRGKVDGKKVNEFLKKKLEEFLSR
jgi:glutamyl-tRNA(Gln) amidotransferase subunit E